MVRSGSFASAKSLTVAALRIAHEFKALAAVATAGEPSQSQAARGALAASADREDALAWLLAVNEGDLDWAGLTEFPTRVRVPDSLRSQLKSFAKTASSTPSGHAAAAMSQLLPKIEPATLRRELSRSILRDADEGTTIRAAARGCLSGSADAADRKALIADVVGQPVPERIARLDALGELRTRRETDEAKKAITVLSVPAVGNGTTRAVCQARFDDTDYLGIYLSGGTLCAESCVAGVRTTAPMTTVEAPFSQATHAHWRLRESQGTALFEYSADGASWVTGASMVHGLGAKVSNLRLRFECDCSGPETAPGPFRVAAINGAGAPGPLTSI